METHRFYNKSTSDLLARIEPWGNDFNIPQGSYLSIHALGQPGLLEIEYSPAAIIIYLNGPEIDEDRTEIVSSTAANAVGK